ncbi:hypothetical protein S245_070506, partial [Arachis hypogaea]
MHPEIGEEKRKRKTLEEKPSTDSAIEASEKKRRYHESIEEEEQDSHTLCELQPLQLSPPEGSVLRLRFPHFTQDEITRRLRRLGKEPTASFTRLKTALPTRPSLSRRFALSRRMKAFLALQFARFLSSRKCSTGILLDNWNVKAICRKTTGIGRMRYLRHVPCQFKSSFREGTEAAPRKKGAAAFAETIHGNCHHLGQALLEETRAALQVYKVSIGAACNLSWPTDFLVIQVLDDSTEPAIKQMVEMECQRWESKGINITYQIREHRTGYKAGALKE